MRRRKELSKTPGEPRLKRKGAARTRRAAISFGVFVVVSLVLLAALTQRIGNLTFFGHQTTYQADMADVTGLISSDPVKIAGVTVGQVTGVGVRHGHAVVTFTVDDTVHLHTSTETGLRSQNVLGQEFLYLYPGTTGGILRPGGVLPLQNSLTTAGVGALLNALGPFLSAINPKEANTLVESVDAALQGNELQVNSLIDNAATVSSTVGSLDTQVGSVIDDLDQVLTALAKRRGDVGTLLDNLQTVSQSLASRNSVLDSVVSNLSKVTGELANLTRANQGNLATAIGDLNSVTNAVQQNEQQLSSGLSTLGAGLAPYTEISSYGQFFQIQTVYLCLAGETTCTYNQPGATPAGSLPGGLVPPDPFAPGPSSTTTSSGGAPSGTGSSGAGTGAAPGTVGSILRMVAGNGSGSGSGSGL